MSARPRVYVEDCHEPPMAAGNGWPERVLAAGGEPFNRKLGQPSEKVTWEEILEFNPEIVIYAVKGRGCDLDPAEFYRTEGFGALDAGKNRRVFSVADGLLKSEEGVAVLRKILEGSVEPGPLVRFVQ